MDYGQVRRLEEDKGQGLRDEVDRISREYLKMSNGWKQSLDVKEIGIKNSVL